MGSPPRHSMEMAGLDIFTAPSLFNLTWKDEAINDTGAGFADHINMNYNYTFNGTTEGNSNMSMSQIFDILHKMDINWSVIREYLNKEDQMLSDNSRLEPGVHNSLIVLYSLVIIFGVVGNFAIL